MQELLGDDIRSRGFCQRYYHLIIRDTISISSFFLSNKTIVVVSPDDKSSAGRHTEIFQ